MLIAQLGTQGPEFHVELNVCLRRSSYNGTKVTMIYICVFSLYFTWGKSSSDPIGGCRRGSDGGGVY